MIACWLAASSLVLDGTATRRDHDDDATAEALATVVEPLFTADEDWPPTLFRAEVVEASPDPQLPAEVITGWLRTIVTLHDYGLGVPERTRLWLGLVRGQDPVLARAALMAAAGCPWGLQAKLPAGALASAEDVGGRTAGVAARLAKTLARGVEAHLARALARRREALVDCLHEARRCFELVPQPLGFGLLDRRRFTLVASWSVAADGTVERPRVTRVRDATSKTCPSPRGPPGPRPSPATTSGARPLSSSTS